MKRFLLVIILLGVVGTGFPVLAFDYIKGRSDYLAEVEGSTTNDFYVAWIHNVVDFYIDRHGVRYSDWLEARSRAVACHVDPVRYAGNVPTTVPGFAGDRNGAVAIPEAERLRYRLSGTNWRFAGYRGCGETTRHAFTFLVRTPAVTTGETPAPERIGLRDIGLVFDSKRGKLTLDYRRQDRVASGQVATKVDRFQRTVDRTTLNVDTAMTGLFTDLAAMILAEDNLVVTASAAGGVVLPASNRIPDTDWMRQVVERLNQISGRYLFSNNVARMLRIRHAISENGVALHLDVIAEGAPDRADLTSRYYVTEQSGTFRLFDGNGTAMGTATTVEATAQMLRRLL